MKRFNGFSLIEMLIVVAIMGILSAIALPAYRDYATRGKLAEASSLLGAQRVKMEQYYQDMRDYTNACTGVTVAFPLPVGQYFTLTCGNLGPNTYTITATGIAGKGADNFVFTINESNVRATAGVPTGWTVPATNCWTRTKNGDC